MVEWNERNMCRGKEVSTSFDIVDFDRLLSAASVRVFSKLSSNLNLCLCVLLFPGVVWIQIDLNELGTLNPELLDHINNSSNTPAEPPRPAPEKVSISKFSYLSCQWGGGWQEGRYNSDEGFRTWLHYIIRLYYCCLDFACLVISVFFCWTISILIKDSTALS